MELHLIALVSPPKMDGRGTAKANIIHLVDGVPVFRKAVSVKHGTDFNPDFRTVYYCGLDGDDFIITSKEDVFRSTKDIDILNCVSNKRATQIGKLHGFESPTDMRGMFLYVRACAVMLAVMAKNIGLEDRMYISSGNAFDQAIELYSTIDCCKHIDFNSFISTDYMVDVFSQASSTVKTFKLYG